MLNLILGEAGTGKSFTLADRIGNAVDEGKNIVVIVPDQFSFEFDRRLYRHLGMARFNTVTVLSFSRLAKDIFIKHGGARGQYADDIVKAVLMYKALTAVSSNEGLVFYDRQVKSPAFLDGALEFVKDMTLNGISPEALSGKINFLSDNIKDKVCDLSVIYSEYSRLMSQSGYKDSLSDITEAAGRAALGGYFNGMSVFIDEFKSFTADELMLIDTAMSQAEEVTVCLSTPEKTPKKFSLFETVNNTAEKLGRLAQKHGRAISVTMLDEKKRYKNAELAFLSGNILRPVRGAYKNNTDAVRIVEASDIYAEIDFVCAQIRHLVMENGYRYNDIAVVSRQLDAYASVIEAALERYDIPFYSGINFPVRHKSLIIFITAALGIASSEKPSTEDYLRYMKTDFLGISRQDIALTESYCYRWNVDGTMWNEPFILDSEGTAEKIRLKVTEPINNFRNKCRNTTGKAICEALYSFFEEVNLFDNIKYIINGCKSTDTAILTAVREIKQLWEMICSVLESLHKILGDTEISLVKFRELFSSVVSKLTAAVPPQTLDAVTVVSAQLARLADPKAVFVIGANEGIFPFAAKAGGLFTDKDRTALEGAGLSLSGGTVEKLSEERFVAYNTLSAPSEKLYISYPLADTSGKALYPSFIISQIRNMFHDNIFIKAKDLGLIYYCTSPKAAYYSYVQNFSSSSAETASLRYMLEQSEEYSERLSYLDSLNFSYRHVLSNEAGRKLFGEKLYVSASRFEDYSICPFVYFCKKGLNIYPQRKAELGSIEQGNAVHFCLSDIMNKHNKESFLALDKSAMLSEIKKSLDSYYNSELGGDYGKTKRFKALFGNIAQTVAEVLVHLQEELAQSDFVPKDFEYSISPDGNQKPKKITTADGTEIYFIGSVDRIDTYTNGDKTYVRVIDYKSGAKTFSFDDLLYGVNMQMLLYLFTLTDGKGKYGNSIPAGVLYMPARDADSSLSRCPDSAEISELKNKNYKMSGIVLENDEVLEAMEKNVQGIYIPVKRTKEAFAKYSKLITDKQLENLRKYSEELLKSMAVSLNGGNVNAVPLVKRGKSPCSYCDYNTVCGNYPNMSVRVYADNAKELIGDILDGKDGNNNG